MVGAPENQSPLSSVRSSQWLNIVSKLTRLFVLTLLIRGVMNSFGAYQAYYEGHILVANTASQISWIGSVQASLLFIVSALSGPLYDLGYMRLLLVAGSAFNVLGMMLTSICHSYWQIMLAQGVLVGIGNGLLFLIAITNIGQYFTTKKALATGIAATGGNFGTYDRYVAFPAKSDH